MGGIKYRSCKYKQPGLYSHCWILIGSYSAVYNFCTLDGPAGDPKRDHVCRQFGPEWEGYTQLLNCGYNWCHDSRPLATGSCCAHAHACCGISGAGAGCKRKQFIGDPLDCCLRAIGSKIKKVGEDFPCYDTDNGMCSNGLNKTEDHWNMVGSDCQSYLYDYFLPGYLATNTQAMLVR